MNKIWFVMIALLSAHTYAGLNADWDAMCNADGNVKRISADVPVVNYNNTLIGKAAEKLHHVASTQEEKSYTLYLYSDIEAVYGCHKRNPGKCYDNKPHHIHRKAHNFLTIACGEFRDNVEMLKAKLEWTGRMNIVQPGKQGYDPDRNVFRQMTFEGYMGLLNISQSIYYKRHHHLGSEGAGHLTLKQKSVPAMTICEYRHIMANYLSQDIDHIDDLASYEDGLSEFIAKGSCSKYELSHYYEFRGDGNFKAQSTESNAMIWNSRVFAKSCSDTKTSMSILTNKQCENYFKRPFASRRNLTKQGLLRLFYYPEDIADYMRNYDYDLVFISEDVTLDGVADMIILTEGRGADLVEDMRANGRKYKKVLAYVSLYASIQQLMERGYPESYLKKSLLPALERGKKAVENSQSLKGDSIVEEVLSMTSFPGVVLVSDIYLDVQDIVIDELVNNNYIPNIYNNLEDVIIGTLDGTIDRGRSIRTQIQKIIRNIPLNAAFAKKEILWDRIATVLDRHTDWYKIDMLNMSAGFYQPTYSPWVASSYYMHSSDNFTKPGYAMGAAGDGHRHWMYVQVVPEERWFNASHLDNTSMSSLNVDMFNTWFDETTFSRSGLGGSEHGWDRFASPTYDEIGEILWLYENDL